ncbi:MAG: hypothetical protein ACYCSP_14925 [Acidobacteriaceae bacterium]
MGLKKLRHPEKGLSSRPEIAVATRGTNTLLWSGIDVHIPTEPTHSQCSPDGVRDAVLAAFHGHADGIILSRKYSKMKLTNLQGARTALHQLRLAT